MQITIAVAVRGCAADVVSHVHGASRDGHAAAGDVGVERHILVEENGQYQCAHPDDRA